jgi:lipopolysaccharide transport system permease protein
MPKSSMTDKDQVIDANRRKIFDWRELIFYKELFYFFTWRDIKVKYKQASLGILWAVIQPLFMMLIFTFFLSSALADASMTLAYPVFVFSGLIIWTVFASGLTNAANSMVTNAPIIKKIYFPRLVIPVSSVLGALFDFLMAFVLFLGLLVYYRQPVSWIAVWCWPLSLVVTIVATLGPGSLLAAMNVKYRDFRYVIPFLVQILFFLTPIIYPASRLSNPVLKYIQVLSPMYAAVELFRWPLTDVAPDPVLILISVGVGIFLLFAGLIYFKNTEDFFADFA